MVVVTSLERGPAALAGDLEALVGHRQGSSGASNVSLTGAAEREPLPQGLAYEAATGYPISDTEERVAGFR